jgi:hypothetical protein
MPRPTPRITGRPGVITGATSPDKAAAIIHHGLERGKARILVGPDAYLFDALARIAPTHYYAAISRLQSGLRARHRESVR